MAATQTQMEAAVKRALDEYGQHGMTLKAMRTELADIAGAEAAASASRVVLLRIARALQAPAVTAVPEPAPVRVDLSDGGHDVPASAVSARAPGLPGAQMSAPAAEAAPATPASAAHDQPVAADATSPVQAAGVDYDGAAATLAEAETASTPPAAKQGPDSAVSAPDSAPSPAKPASTAKSFKEGAAAGTKRSAGAAQHASELPLVVPKLKRKRATMLVQMPNDGHNAWDVRGDTGAVGRLLATKEGVVLDLQGHRYAGHIMPTCTHMVVSITGKEARIESVVNDIVSTQHLTDVLASIGGSLTAGNEDLAQLATFADVDSRAKRGAAAAAASASIAGTGTLSTQPADAAAAASTSAKRAGVVTMIGKARTAKRGSKSKR